MDSPQYPLFSPVSSPVYRLYKLHENSKKIPPPPTGKAEKSKRKENGYFQYNEEFYTTTNSLPTTPSRPESARQGNSSGKYFSVAQPGQSNSSRPTSAAPRPPAMPSIQFPSANSFELFNAVRRNDVGKVRHFLEAAWEFLLAARIDPEIIENFAASAAGGKINNASASAALPPGSLSANNSLLTFDREEESGKFHRLFSRRPLPPAVALLEAPQRPLAFRFLQQQFHAVLNCRDAYSSTPLHYAAKNGSLVLCQLFLSSGHCFDLRQTNYQFDSPFSLAIKHGHKEIIRLFLQYGLKCTRIQYLALLKRIFRQNPHLRRKKFLRESLFSTPLIEFFPEISLKDNEFSLDYRAFHLSSAVRSGNLLAVKQILAWHGENPLPNTIFTLSPYERRAELINYPFRGVPIVFYAVYHGFLQILLYFLCQGCQIHCEILESQWSSIGFSYGHKNYMDFLEKQSEYYQSSENSLKKKSIMKHSLSSPSSSSSSSLKEKWEELFFQRLLQRERRISSSSLVITPLSLAISRHHYYLSGFLHSLNGKLPGQLKDEENFPFPSEIYWNSQISDIQREMRVKQLHQSIAAVDPALSSPSSAATASSPWMEEIVLSAEPEMIIEIMNSPDSNGETALFHAIKSPKPMKMIEFVLSHGGNINQPNSSNEKPIELALKMESIEIVEYLIDFGAEIPPTMVLQYILLEEEDGEINLSEDEKSITRGGGGNFSSSSSSPHHHHQGFISPERGISMVSTILESLEEESSLENFQSILVDCVEYIDRRDFSSSQAEKLFTTILTHSEKITGNQSENLFFPSSSSSEEGIIKNKLSAFVSALQIVRKMKKKADLLKKSQENPFFQLGFEENKEFLGKKNSYRGKFSSPQGGNARNSGNEEFLEEGEHSLHFSSSDSFFSSTGDFPGGRGEFSSEQRNSELLKEILGVSGIKSNKNQEFGGNANGADESSKNRGKSSHSSETPEGKSKRRPRTGDGKSGKNGKSGGADNGSASKSGASSDKDVAGGAKGSSSVYDSFSSAFSEIFSDLDGARVADERRKEKLAAEEAAEKKRKEEENDKSASNDGIGVDGSVDSAAGADGPSVSGSDGGAGSLDSAVDEDSLTGGLECGAPGDFSSPGDFGFSGLSISVDGPDAILPGRHSRELSAALLKENPLASPSASPARRARLSFPNLPILYQFELSFILDDVENSFGNSRARAAGQSPPFLTISHLQPFNPFLEKIAPSPRPLALEAVQLSDWLRSWNLVAKHQGLAAVKSFFSEYGRLKALAGRSPFSVPGRGSHRNKHLQLQEKIKQDKMASKRK